MAIREGDPSASPMAKMDRGREVVGLEVIKLLKHRMISGSRCQEVIDLSAIHKHRELCWRGDLHEIHALSIPRSEQQIVAVPGSGSGGFAFEGGVSSIQRRTYGDASGTQVRPEGTLGRIKLAPGFLAVSEPTEPI